MINKNVFFILLFQAFLISDVYGQDSLYKSFKVENNIVMDNNQLQNLVCKLSGSALVERKVKLQTEVFSKVVKVEEQESAYEFYFNDSDDIGLKIMDLILVEKECCPFFVFNVTFKPGEDLIVLNISGPAEAQGLFKGRIY